MKKVIAILAVAIIGMSAAFSAKAIEDPNPKGTFVAGAQVGVLPFGVNVFGDYVLVDSWWKGHFTVGGMAGFSTILTHGYGYTYFPVAARATYGLNITSQFEVHVGVLTGVQPYTFSYSDGSKDFGVNFIAGGITGARFFFTEGFGVSAEINYAGAFPIFNGGVVLKF